MAVTYNHITGVGDSFIVKPGVPLVGVDLVFDFVDDVEGVTSERFFVKEFRYSNDGITYTDWEIITPGNLQKINIFNKQIFDIEYRYTRAGSDNTGVLIFNSCSLKIIYTPVENPNSYNDSFFSDFFDFSDPDVLKWAINVLGKVYEKGIVPDFIERTDDYKTFFSIITHWFAIIVNYARLYNKIEDKYELLYDFLRQRGIILKNSHEKDELYQFMNKIFNIYLLRGTKLSKNEEVNRLINYSEGGIFISALLEDWRRGWNINNSSPLYRGLCGTLNTSIGFESVYGVKELDKYPIPQESEPFCKITYIGYFQVIHIDSPPIYHGISASKTHALPIDPRITWEVEAIVQSVGLNNDPSFLRFGCKMYNSDLEEVDTFSIETGIADNSEGNFVDDAVLVRGQKTVIRGIIYKFDEGLMSSENSKLNIGQGKNLKSSISAKFLSVTLKFKGETRGLLIYSLKIRPAALKAPIGFISIVNPIVSWIETKNLNLNKIQVLKEIIEKFIPYNSNFLPIWIDEISESEFIPLTIVQIIKNNISCNLINDGSITIQVSGGKPPYMYSLNDLPYQSSNYFDGLSDGNYVPKVKDSDGVVAIGTDVIISRPSIISINEINIVDVSMYNGNDGSITVIASGGTQPLIYSIKKDDNQWSQYQPINVFTGLSEGIYKVRVSDVKNCPPVESDNIIITQPQEFKIVNVISTDTTCSYLNNGTITIETINGIPPIEYKLNENGSWQSSNVFTGLSAGTYKPFAKDSSGYQIQGISKVINKPPELMIISASVHPDNRGFDVEVFGGTGPNIYVSYKKDNGLWSSWVKAINMVASFNNLSPGTYYFRAHDSNGCSAYSSFSAVLPEVPANVNVRIVWNNSFYSRPSDGVGGVIEAKNSLDLIVASVDVPKYTKDSIFTITIPEPSKGYKLDFSKLKTYKFGIGSTEYSVSWGEGLNSSGPYSSNKITGLYYSEMEFLVYVA